MKLLSRISLLPIILAATGQLFSAQVPRFLKPVTYDVPGATVIAVGDVNGDGILDLVTANAAAPTGDGGVSVLLGIGHGTFKPAVQIVEGGSPSFVVLADFNHDGKLDIATANEANPNSTVPVVGGPPLPSVSVLLGNGDGTFKPAIITPTAGALELAKADFNGDGKMDLAVSSDAGVPVQILLGNGDGTFTVSDIAADSLFGVIAGDFNGDGKPDILAAGLQLLGNGDGTFGVGTPLPVTPVLAADFNGDGILDLCELFVSDGRFITGLMALGLPNGQWSPSFIDDFNGFGLVAADFNGDGKMDIFGTGDSVGDIARAPIGGLGLGVGDGTFTFGSFGFGAPFGSVIVASFPVAGDFDGNGSPDIAIATGTGILVALNTFGHPALLAQLSTDATFVVGGVTTVTGTLSLGGPAPAGGALVTLTSSNPAAVFPNGKTVKIPAGAVTAEFTISTSAVTTSTPVTIAANYHFTRLTTPLHVVAPVMLTSVSVAPVSLIGMFGGDAAVGTVKLGGPAANGTVVNLTSANAKVLTVPLSVAFIPGATTATFAVSAQHVAADIPVTVSAEFGTTTRTGTVTVRKETATVVITKAEYIVKKGLLTVEANSNDRVASLQIFNPSTGAQLGTIPIVNVGKFVGQVDVTGTLTSIAAQSSVGGLSISSVAQK
jgi:FG-GAP-like repeat